MSKPLRAEHIAYISDWLRKMEDGDMIVRRGNTVAIYNGSGCDLDCIEL